MVSTNKLLGIASYKLKLGKTKIVIALLPIKNIWVWMSGFHRDLRSGWGFVYSKGFIWSGITDSKSTNNPIRSGKISTSHVTNLQ